MRSSSCLGWRREGSQVSLHALESFYGPLTMQSKDFFCTPFKRYHPPLASHLKIHWLYRRYFQLCTRHKRSNLQVFKSGLHAADLTVQPFITLTDGFQILVMRSCLMTPR